MKWSSPLPRLRHTWVLQSYNVGWGLRYVPLHASSNSLELHFYLGYPTLEAYLTWPERSP